MGNGNEIIGKITAKLENARVWYDNARSAARYFAKSDTEEEKELSESYMADAHAIKGYMDELGEMIYLSQMDENLEITLFEEETRENFEHTCNLYPDRFPINYDYVAFFLCGGSSKKAYIYIKPIAYICEEKYPKYYELNTDGGD